MSAAAPLDRRGLALLSGGHMCTDLCQGAVPALLPFLIAERGYSYSAAASLVLAVTVGSSVIQPLFGHASDRLGAAWLMPLGVALSGLGLALSGLAPSYGLTFAAIAISGVGVAAFHPEAARFANYASGSRKGSGMSFFSVGGNAGFALGPALVTPAILILGLHGTLAVAALPAIAALVLALSLPRLERLRPPPQPESADGAAGAPDQWGPFARLTGLISLRSCVYFGLQAFAPAYLVAELGASKGGANAALTLMLASGAVGTLVGGRYADRVGPQVLLLGATAALAPLLVVFLMAGHVLAVPLLALIGFVTVGTFSITVMLGQSYLPSRIGTASGVTLGAAIGVGGIAAPLLGLVADHWGLQTAMWTIAVIPLPAVALALTLPRRSRRPVAAARA
jgi:FSR family fosmidomycin resistance protein-like MFS transporter